MPPVELRSALEATYATWKNDLVPAWRSFFDGAEVAVAAVPSGLPLVQPDDVVFPGRKGAPPKGARPDAHVLRAFDGLPPASVRVVVIGQDPYLHVDQATGRSFEQADVGDDLAGVSPSLRRIFQAVALRRTGDRRFVEGADGWKRVLAARALGEIDLPAPLPLWDRWQKAGAVFVNAACTFNKFEPRYQKAHLAFWTPVVGHLVRTLAARKGRGVVFVAWGQFAQGVLAAADVESAARAAGRWLTRVRIVAGPHPNAMGKGPPFLLNRDPLREVDDALGLVGEKPVGW